MRIAQITPFFPPVIGGVENAVWNISKILAKAGHQVDVYTANTGLARSEVRDGVNIQRFPVLFNIGRFAKLWPTFIESLRRQRYDMIHTHVYRHPHSTLVNLYSMLSRKTAVISTHGPFHPNQVWGRLAPFVKLHDLLLGYTLNGFNRILVQNDLERELLGNMHVSQDRIRLLPNGVDSEHFKKYNPRPFLNRFGIESSYLCYLGRIHPTKGLEFLLKSFARLRNGSGHGFLLIAGPGEGSYVESLMRLVRSLSIESVVKFVGCLSEEDKMLLLEGCNGLVLPSRYEPYGIVLLEAMAHRKPVIATYPGGTDFVLHNRNGFLVRYGDEEGLSQCMSKLLTEGDVGRALGDSAYQLARERTWESIVGKLQRIYEEILN